MLRSIVVAAIVTVAASTAQAQTAGAMTGRLASVQVATATPPSNSGQQVVNRAATAKAVIEAHGYREVKNLSQDSVGNWAGEAVRDHVEVAVVLQVDGEITEE